MKKRLPSVEHVETLSLVALRRLVGGLVEELHALKAEVVTLRSENEALREDNAQLRLDNARLKAENQQLRDEIARLKSLPPRPPFRPSGMEKATEPGNGDRAAGKTPRGPKRDRSRITRTVTLRVDAPEGSRFKGYKSFFVRDLVLAAELVNYRRERWLTPEGKVIVAPLPEGVSSGFGRNLRRACLALHPRGRSQRRASPRSSTASASRSRSGRLSGYSPPTLSSSSRKTVRFCMPGWSRRRSSRSTTPV